MHWSPLCRNGPRSVARIRPDLDVMTPALMQEVKVTADIRSRGQTLNDYFAQQSDKLPDAVRDWMGIFYDGGGRRVSARSIVKTLHYYLDETTKAISNNPESSRR
jgi:hypothetical protein